MTAPNVGARGDARKRHDAPTCLVCGNSVPVDASALAAAKAEALREGAARERERLLARVKEFDVSDNFHAADANDFCCGPDYYSALSRVEMLLLGKIAKWTDPHPQAVTP